MLAYLLYFIFKQKIINSFISHIISQASGLEFFWSYKNQILPHYRIMKICLSKLHYNENKCASEERAKIHLLFVCLIF